MIQTLAGFIQYFEGIRRRTLNYLRLIPADKLNWAPKEGEFTCGDIARHILSAERMFVGVVAQGRWKYQGHEDMDGRSLEETLTLLEQSHTQAMEILKSLPDTILQEKRPSLKGPEASAWRWLMAMTEHEIHHRSQLAVYLSLMGIQPPHIYGLGVEDLIALAVG